MAGLHDMRPEPFDELRTALVEGLAELGFDRLSVPGLQSRLAWRFAGLRRRSGRAKKHREYVPAASARLRSRDSGPRIQDRVRKPETWPAETSYRTHGSARSPSLPQRRIPPIVDPPVCCRHRSPASGYPSAATTFSFYEPLGPNRSV